MIKPTNWETLNGIQLTDWIHDLNVWNSDQPVPDHVHNAHYKSEIAPLVKLREQLRQEFANKRAS